MSDMRIARASLTKLEREIGREVMATRDRSLWDLALRANQ